MNHDDSSEKLGDASQELLLSVAPFFQVEEGYQQLRKLNHDDFCKKLGDTSLELLLSVAPFFQVEEGCQQSRKLNHDDFSEKILLSAEIIISFHSSSWQKITKGIGYALGPAYRFPVVENSTEKI